MNETPTIIPVIYEERRSLTNLRPFLVVLALIGLVVLYMVWDVEHLPQPPMSVDEVTR